MARIPEHEIERLKREISVERLAVARGVELRRHGADLMGRCPFHDDHTPSLVITPSRNLWHCLGACGAGGGPIDWVMRAEGVSFRHAVELLRADYRPRAKPGGPPPRHGTTPKLEAPLTRAADDARLLGEVVDYYHQTLKQTPEALGYLDQRGLRSAEMLERFRLGFANRTLGYRLPASNRQAGAEMRGRLQSLGILRESGHEHFNGSITVPLADASGAIVGMYGRKITPNLRAGTPDHLYLPGPHRGVWNEAGLAAPAAEGTIILCEALLDALTFWCAGFRNVTASYGVNGFTAEHRAALEKYGVRQVYLAYDADAAGDGAAEALAEELMAQGIECFRVRFPKGMDANEYALKVQPPDRSLGVLLRGAAWLGKGLGKERKPAMSPPAIPVPPEPEPTSSVPVADEDENKTLPKDKVAREPTPALAAPEPQEEEERERETEPEAARAAEPETNAVGRPEPANFFPLAAAPAMTVEESGDEVRLSEGGRVYRVRGLGKNLSYELLRVNLLVSWPENPRAGFHVDTLDLYAARQRALYAKQAALELGMGEEAVRVELGRVLLRLEAVQHERIRQALAPAPEAPKMDAAEEAEALALLRAPDLMERILADFERCGMVGEAVNKQVAYLAAVSRLLEQPLAVIVQSSSAAGKSSLMEAVLAFLPPEQKAQYSAMTGQSLYYMGAADLKHKVLAVVEEEGAARASYALKLLQSEGALSIASTGKDPATGKLVTHEYHVEGPVMIFLTTTAHEVDEELLNRCLVLGVNEAREQTRAIHERQRRARTLAGLRERAERAAILQRHRNAQRLLRPLRVVNEYAPRLGFPDGLTRARRDHVKLLTLIEAIALLHQYQRPLRRLGEGPNAVDYIEADERDVRLAMQLATEVLGRSLDELPPQTRRLLGLVDEMVKRGCGARAMTRAEFRFSRRDVRESTGWGDTQLKLHLHRLEELEYLIVHRGGRGQGFVYELIELPEGEPAEGRFLAGIQLYDLDRSGVERELAGPSRGQVGPVSGGGRGEESPVLMSLLDSSLEKAAKNTATGAGDKNGVVVVAAGAWA